MEKKKREEKEKMSIYASDKLFPERWLVRSNLYIHILECDFHEKFNIRLIASFDVPDDEERKTLIVSACGQVIFAGCSFNGKYDRVISYITIYDLNANTWRELSTWDCSLPWPSDFTVVDKVSAQGSVSVVGQGKWGKTLTNKIRRGKFYRPCSLGEDDELVPQRKCHSRLVAGEYSIDLDTGEIFINLHKGDKLEEKTIGGGGGHTVDTFASSCFVWPVREEWKKLCMEQVEWLCGMMVEHRPGITFHAKEKYYFGTTRLPILECDFASARDIFLLLQKELQYIQPLVDIIVGYLVEDISISPD